MNRKRGILAVISGFSGSGKGTVIKKMQEMYPDAYRLSISATTRAPRPGEEDKVHYFFITREQFEELIAGKLLLEHAVYHEQYYGTPVAYVEQNLKAGYDVILEIEQQGAFQVKKAVPDCVLIFLGPPSIAELEQRLRGRKSETEADIDARLAIAAEEARCIDRYDAFVINDIPEECAVRVHEIIEAQKRKVLFNRQEIEALQQDLWERFPQHEQAGPSGS